MWGDEGVRIWTTRSWVAAVAAAVSLMAAASAAHAKPPDRLTIPDNYDCRQTFANYGPFGMPSWVIGDRGHLAFHVSQTTGKPTSYDFDAFWLTTQPRAGGWAWNGRAQFRSGPLGGQTHGWPKIAGHWYAKPRVMPHDTVRGRTAQLVLVSLGPSSADYVPAVQGREGRDGHQTSYWYCGRRGLVPRQLFGRALTRVQQQSGIKVRLPTWFQTLTQGADPGQRGVVRSARTNSYRLDIVRRRCRASCAVGVFAAKRAPASQLGHRNPVKLANGVHGWVGSVGCGFNPGPDWGPVYCGMGVVVWHQHGINYAIQEPGADDALLLDYANQTIRYG
jgi:hypothetical protein